MQGSGDDVLWLDWTHHVDCLPAGGCKLRRCWGEAWTGLAWRAARRRWASRQGCCRLPTGGHPQHAVASTGACHSLLQAREGARQPPLPWEAAGAGAGARGRNDHLQVEHLQPPQLRQLRQQRAGSRRGGSGPGRPRPRRRFAAAGCVVGGGLLRPRGGPGIIDCQGVSARAGPAARQVA